MRLKLDWDGQAMVRRNCSAVCAASVRFPPPQRARLARSTLSHYNKLWPQARTRKRRQRRQWPLKVFVIYGKWATTRNNATRSTRGNWTGSTPWTSGTIPWSWSVCKELKVSFARLRERRCSQTFRLWAICNALNKIRRTRTMELLGDHWLRCRVFVTVWFICFLLPNHHQL